MPVAMRRYGKGARIKTDPKVRLVWIPKYRKKVLVGPIAVRARDAIGQIALERELEIVR